MLTIRRNHDITAHTTFGVHAECAAFVEWQTVADLQTLWADSSLPRPFKAIGGGSNLLFTRPFAGTILYRTPGTLPSVAPGADSVEVEASLVLDDVCAHMASLGIGGWENLSGIPGTVGGALVQNAGAYGAEIGDAVMTLQMFNLSTGELLSDVPRDFMQYAYRHSRLKEGGEMLIVSARFALPKPGEWTPNLRYGNLSAALATEAEVTPEAVRQAVLAMRRSKLPDPAEVGSAGSFFRNPEVDPEMLHTVPALASAPGHPTASGRVKIPAAWLIDQCGMKGRRCGGAQVWQQQPLVIANAEGTATATDVAELEREIIQAVNQKFHITLIPEVEHL